MKDGIKEETVSITNDHHYQLQVTQVTQAV